VAKDREDIELAFNVELETRKAMRSISNIDKQLRKTVNSKLQIKSFDSKAVKVFTKELAHSKRVLREVAFSMSPSKRAKFKKDFAEMGKAYKILTLTVTRERSKISALEKRMQKTDDEFLKKALENQIKIEKKASIKAVKAQRKIYADKRNSFGKRLISSGGGANIEKRTNQAQAAKEFIEGVKASKTGAELAEGFKDAVSSMSSKDIFGLAKAGSKMGGGLLKGLAKVSMAKGAGISAKGKEMGGGMGAALKGLGGAMKGVGPLLGSLSKLGPMLGLVGSAMFALIKVFLDADAAVKEMNRTVLEGGSTWDTYGAKGRNVEAGMGRMDESLKRLRDETTDLRMNLSMGTTAKEHQQVINTLEREGITLEKLTVSFGKYTDISKQSIVYSRLFGVSVDEISQMQAEMMQQMGSGLNDLGKEFDMIGKAAEDSGIAQNKFFAMLRGVSSDLSLYGVRIGETTKMLGQLGKVMSPRTADKFLKAFAQGFKGKSIQDRLKSMLLGGPGAIKAIQQDISSQITDLVEKVKDAVPGLDDKSAMAMLSGKSVGGQSLKKLEKAGKIQGSGALIESFQKLEMAAKQSKQGAYGAAQAAETAGGYAAYKAQKAGLRIGGAKSFTQASTMGVGGHQAAILAAGGEEQLEAMIGIERAIEQQKNDLMGAIDDPESDKDLIDVLKKMKKFDEHASKDQQRKMVESMSEDEVWKSLDQKNAEAGKSQADKDAEAMRKMGEEQGQRTQDMLSKLDLIFDALYNRIYGVMMDIADTINLKWGFSKNSAIRGSALASKNSEVNSAWGNSGGDVGKYMGALSNTDTAKRIDSLLHSTDPKDMAKASLQKSDIANTFGMSSLTGDIAKDLADAIKASGIVGSDAERILSAQKGGADIRGSIAAGGLTDKAEADLYTKMALWFTNAEGRTNIMGAAPGISKFDAGGSGIAATSAPTAQQQASSKSANPGTGGTAVPVAASSPATSTPAGGFYSQDSASQIQLPDEKKMNEAVLSQVDFTGEAVVNSLQDLWKAMRQKGIKLDKVQLKGEYQEVIYKGAQKALFEYALYTAQNPAETLKKMKDSGFGGLGDMAGEFQKQQDLAKSQNQDTLVGHAAGGVVTGINGGLANINPAPGEGLTSIGRGERIVPAGGGGGSGDIHLHVDGLGGADLANYLKGKIAQGVHEYKRREKFS
jgi:hypothetical protein